MLTPQEVQEKTFSKAVFGGYDMAAVDDFLEPLSEDYITLYKENAVLKNKMKVLVDTVESYRSTEDAMRSVLINAQKTADQIVSEAQAKANTILNEAEKVASSKVGDLDNGVRIREAQLAAAKQNTLNYIDKMRKLYSRQLEFLENLENLEEHNSAKKVETAGNEAPKTGEAEQPEPNEAGQDAAAAMDQTRRIDTIDQDVPSKAEGASQQPAAAGQENATKPKFEFIDLQFGKDYELK